MIYLKFDMPNPIGEDCEPKEVKHFLLNSMFKILKRIVPEANPDYDDKIKEVDTWIVEIDEETNFPNREIGLDKNKNVIVAMPDERNYGYWTDNNLNKDDFHSHFEVKEITEKEFTLFWSEIKNKK